VSHVNQTFHGVLNNDVVAGTFQRSSLNIEEMERDKQGGFFFVSLFELKEI
jgi:hypothetical protein